MKIYETNSGLGYNQLAYLIRLDKTENGYNYLCIGGYNLKPYDIYTVGEITELYDTDGIAESTFKIQSSPLYNDVYVRILLEEFRKYINIRKTNNINTIDKFLNS